MAAKPTAVIVDIDGTLALLGKRNPYSTRGVGEDAPNEPVIEVVRALHDRGHTIVVVSGRDESALRETEAWLGFHLDVPIVGPYLRKRGDGRKDAAIKKEVYQQRIEPRFDVVCVLDDRDQTVRMWRRLGLTCLQVAYGDF